MLIKSNDWIELEPPFRAKLYSYNVYAYTKLSNATKHKNVMICLYIGKDVCDLLQWTADTKIKILRNRIENFQFKLKKSNLSGSRKLCATKGSNIIRLTFSSPKDLKLKEMTTTLIDFETLDDDSLVIDLSKFKG